MTLPLVRRLPDGYYKTSVVFSEREWVRISALARLQPHQTASEAIRRLMGMSANPHLLARRLQEQAELEARESTNNEE